MCLFFQRNSFFTLLFLVPLGFLAFRHSYRAAWAGLFFAVAGNTVISSFLAYTHDFPVSGAAWDILYFTVMVSIFVCITAPPPALPAKATGAVRLVAGSCLGALLFAVIFFKILASPDFAEYLASLIDALVPLYSAAGADVVQSALLEAITPEAVLDALKNVMLRGGSLASCVLLFSVSRQISLALANFSRREKGAPSLVLFHVLPALIWVFSVSLLLVVLTRIAKIEPLEIILWNVLVLCAILYFAQGLGVLQFFLARVASPFLKFFLHVLFAVLLFSPGINAVLLGGVAILGIAENWVPFRAPKQDGPPSTPEAGDD